MGLPICCWRCWRCWRATYVGFVDFGAWGAICFGFGAVRGFFWCGCGCVAREVCCVFFCGRGAKNMIGKVGLRVIVGRFSFFFTLHIDLNMPSMRARRVGDYVMTEAKQARMLEIAQQERDRDLATLLAQQQLSLEPKSESAPTHVEPTSRLKSSESEEK